MRLFANIYESEPNRIITINESQVMSLLFEAATIQDIHEKYYSDIPEDIFKQIVSSDPTYNTNKPDKMGKFGKWLLSIYQKGNLKVEDLYKASEYLSIFVRFNSKIEAKDITKYKSLQELYGVIKPFIDNPEQSASKSEDIRKLKEGAEKVYEDEKWLVIVPHTEEAACYYGKGTQWCTAAEKSENMFGRYNEEGRLYINIVKGTDIKYQFHFETQQFMDATDTEIQPPVADSIGLTPRLVEFYESRYGVESLALTNNFTMEDLFKVDGLDNYYVGNDYSILYTYDEKERKLREVMSISAENYHLGYDEINTVALFGRYIPIYHNYLCLNLFDVKRNDFLFDKKEKPYLTIIDNYNYVIVSKDDSTNDLYSLAEDRYIAKGIPQDFEILSPLYNRQMLERYNKDLTMVRMYDTNSDRNDPIFALFSLSKAKLLSNWFYMTRREYIYYNGKPLLFEVLANDNGYDNAYLVMYDGTLYPYKYFASNSDIILDNFFNGKS